MLCCMASGLIPKRLGTIFISVLYSATALLGVVLLCNLGWAIIRLSGIVKGNPISPEDVILIMGMSVSLMAGVLWFMSVTKVLNISSTVEKLLFRSLIAGILAATVGAFLTSSSKPKTTNSDQHPSLPPRTDQSIH